MKAAVLTRYGPPEVVEIQDMPAPFPRDNEGSCACMPRRVLGRPDDPQRAAARAADERDSPAEDQGADTGHKVGNVVVLIADTTTGLVAPVQP